MKTSLEGRIVKVHFPESEKPVNNYQPTAPAIVVTDWGSSESEESAKALNLQIFTDCNGTRCETSVMHMSVSEQPLKNFAWELYE